MKKSSLILYTAARICFASAVFYWFFLYMGIVSGAGSISLSPVCPLAGIAVVYIAGLIVTGKGIRFWPYVALQALITAAGTVWIVLSLSSDPKDATLAVFTAIAYVITAGISAKAAAGEISQQPLTIRFDISVILSALLLLTGHYKELPLLPGGMGLLLAAMLLIVIALTVMRSGEGAGLGSAAGRVLPFVLIVIIGLATAALYLFAAGGAGKLTEFIISAVKAVWGAFVAALAFIWAQWTRFCGWLSRLFKPGEYIPEPIDVQPDEVPVPDAAEPSAFAVAVLYIMTALMVIALLVAVYTMLRNIRLRRKGRKKLNNRRVVRKGSSMGGLKEALGRLAAKMRYRFACARYRNTPAGLLAWCERKASRKEKKQREESGMQFLRRLASSREGEEKEALTALADLVEKDFYSGTRSAAAAGLCSAVRRCRF